MLQRTLQSGLSRPSPTLMAGFPVFQEIEGEWTSVKTVEILGVRIPAYFTTDPQLLYEFITNFQTKPDDVFIVSYPKSGKLCGKWFLNLQIMSRTTGYGILRKLSGRQLNGVELLMSFEVYVYIYCIVICGRNTTAYISESPLPRDNSRAFAHDFMIPWWGVWKFRCCPGVGHIADFQFGRHTLREFSHIFCFVSCKISQNV